MSRHVRAVRSSLNCLANHDTCSSQSWTNVLLAPALSGKFVSLLVEHLAPCSAMSTGLSAPAFGPRCLALVFMEGRLKGPNFVGMNGL